MNTKSLVVLVLLVAGIGAVLFTVLGDTSEGRGGAQESLRETPGKVRPVSASAEPGLVTPKGDTQIVATTTPSASSRIQLESEIIGDADNFETDAATWISVTVHLPTGVPVDDDIVLLAVSKPGQPGALQEIGSSIETDWEAEGLEGGFNPTRAFLNGLDDDISWSRRVIKGSTTVRIPFPPDAVIGQVAIASRYVYAPTALVVIDEKLQPTIIEGQLGAYVTGHITLPADAIEVKSDDIDLSFVRRGNDMSFMFRSDAIALEEDLSYEMRALPAGSKYAVSANADDLVAFLEMGFAPVAGKHTVYDIPMQVGGTVTGRVVGDNGEPIEGAQVSASGGGRRSFMFSGRDNSVASAEDGTYTMRGIHPGECTIQTTAEGWLDSEKTKLEIADGQEVAGIDFTLDSGNRITGVVVWADGTPAVEADVNAFIRKKGGWRDDITEAKTDAKGAFTLSGLGSDAVDLEAKLAPDGSTPPEDHKLELELPDGVDVSMLEGWGDDGRNAKSHLAFKDDIMPGADGIVLTLIEPLAFTGRVVDDTGNPVTDFEITAKPANSPRWGNGESLDEDFEAEDGAFTMEGVYAGDWIVKAAADGYAATDEKGTTVAIPSGATNVLLTLNRAVRVTGVVVDPSGAPIRLMDGDAARVEASDGTESRFGERSSVSATTDDEGRFELENCSPNGLTLVAQHEDWASSEPLVIETTPGSSHEGITLTLRIGATITGEVYDDEGNPEIGRTVAANSGGSPALFGGETQTTTDSSGFFILEHIEPGSVTVVATPSQDDMMDAFSSSDDELEAQEAVMGMFSQMKMETIEVEDGAEVHVVLGSEPKSPVHVTGTVVLAGEPQPNMTIIAIQEGGAILQGMKMGHTDESGRFELTVDRPGDFQFSVDKETFGNGQTQIFVEVPEVEEFEVTLVIPRGRIEGTVTGPDGSRLGDVKVRVSRAGGVAGLFDMMQGNDTSTAEDGSYHFDNLEAGEYTVRVGDTADIFSTGQSHFGTVVVSNIQVEEEATTEGVDVRLTESGKVIGTVRDAAGAPVVGATVFVRDGAGALLSNVSSCATNGTGQFTYEGVPTGDVWVLARTGDTVSSELGPIRVNSGGETNANLTLSEGTFLLITLTRDGEPVRARLLVLDREGRQVSGLYSENRVQSLIMQGTPTDERRIGPLPPGKYTVHATANDGTTAKKSVTVREGQDERRVKLRIK